MLDLKSLRYLRSVVECGSFSLAAERVGRTQQALSKCITQLEAELGVSLLDRDIRRVTPTAIGRVLLEHSKAIDIELDKITAAIDAINGQHVDKLAIGSSATAAATIMPRALLAILDAMPEIQLSVYSGIYVDMLPRLLSGELDLFIGLEIAPVQHPDIEKQVLGYESFALMTHRDHPLQRAGRCDLDAALAYPWIIGNHLPGISQQITAQLSSHATAPQLINTNSMDFCIAALLSGDYIGVLPRSWLNSPHSDNRLCELPLTEFSSRYPVILCYARQKLKKNSFLKAANIIEGATKVLFDDGKKSLTEKKKRR